jgi:hypothetical protein
VENSCEHGNEPSDSIILGVFLSGLSRRTHFHAIINYRVSIPTGCDGCHKLGLVHFHPFAPLHVHVQQISKCASLTIEDVFSVWPLPRVY